MSLSVWDEPMRYRGGCRRGFFMPTLRCQALVLRCQAPRAPLAVFAAGLQEVFIRLYAGATHRVMRAYRVGLPQSLAHTER